MTHTQRAPYLTMPLTPARRRRFEYIRDSPRTDRRVAYAYALVLAMHDVNERLCKRLFEGLSMLK